MDVVKEVVAPKQIAEPIDDERIASLLGRKFLVAGDGGIDETGTLLDELIERYEEVKGSDEESARAARQAFLLTVRKCPQALERDDLSKFLVDEIGGQDVSAMQWKSADDVTGYCETLYKLQFMDDGMVEKLTDHAHETLRHALQDFEQRGLYEEMIKLLRVAPIPLAMSDARLRRLYNRAYLYEMRRGQRRRRYLYAYLILQTLFILVIFPVLFIKAENGAIQREIEKTAKVDLPEDPQKQFLSYSDGLYWSVITAGSIGYGDITPVTKLGKMIAGTLGVMGVITIGIFASLILSWVQPRRFF